MSIKDLFDKRQTGKILPSKTRETLADGIESVDYLTDYVTEEERFIPPVDFSEPKNFARFGSAKEYYSNSIKRIYNTYPYDGSLKEKIQWENSSSYFDKFIFQKEYPRTTGYIHIGRTYGTLGSNTQNYYTSSNGEYIWIKGGPHASAGALKDGRFNKVFDEHPAANIYHTASNRGSNLALHGDKGATVEFWLKKSAYSAGSESKNQIIFDLWNSASFGAHDYGRFRIETRPDTVANGDRIWVSLISGAHGTTTAGPAGGIYSTDATLATSIGSNIAITGSAWKHYAVSIANTGSSMRLRLYVDGALNEQKILGNTIGEVPGAMQGYIGALANSVSGAYAAKGWGKLSGSVDEFRYWKTERTPKEIGRFWRSQVGGGTNTDNANTQLGVYYKFNEGATGTGSIDSKILDYSGRISNGTWFGYASGSRNVVNSAMVEASASATEFKDPIIYSFHPEVIKLASSSSLKATEWDYNNNSSVYHSFPSWIIDEDESEGAGNLKKLTHIMSSVFDNLQLQIEYLPKLKESTYPTSSLNSSTTYKPRPFSEHLLESYGFDTSDLFEDISALERYYNRNEHTLYEEKLHDLKNLIYQNIYNGLSRIYKSKGTERSLRNLIRCFGIDDELLKINLYGNEVTYKLEDNYRTVSQAKKYANFNDAEQYQAYDYSSDRSSYSAVVFQAANPTNSNTVSYISGTDVDSHKFLDGMAFTVEAEAVFPKPAQTEKYDIVYPFLTCSVFGVNQVDLRKPSSQTIWHTGNVAQFNVYACRPELGSNDAHFLLTNSGSDFSVTTKTFHDVFDNSKWNFAVSVRPKKYPYTDIITGTKLSSSGPVLENSLDNYILEFYGTNTEYGTIIDEFALTSSLTNLTGNIMVSAPKRVYAGAHRLDTTGSLLASSNAKVSSVRYWLDYLTSSVIQAHARDALNFGTENPYENSYLFKSEIATTYADGRDGLYPFIPKMSTLALNWDFSNVTGSDSDGIFYVDDFSSGSTANIDRFGKLSGILNNLHSGKGQFFVTSSHGVLDKVYTPSARQQLPEVLNSSDMINILKRDDTTFTRETRPIQYFFAIEKSMYQTISEEILNFFASVKDFNNLIGEPVNRYRQEYKILEKLRQLFFERIHNDPDLDKYVEFYKWFDASVTNMIMNLIPASVNTSGQVHNMVESHILERNKYWTKFPTMETEGKTPEGKIMGVNELSYNWKHGHAPIPQEEQDNCFWWESRAERSTAAISSSVVGVNSDKDKLLKTITTEVSASGPLLYDSSTSTTYEGSTYALRKLSKTYRLVVDKKQDIKSGQNSYENKRKDYHRGKLKWNDPKSFIRFVKTSFEKNKDCNDVINPITSSKIPFTAIVHPSSSTDYLTSGKGKGDLMLPFNLHSSSISTGYSSLFADNTMVDLANLHEDNYYGNTKEVPMQGPFTEKYVGGVQYRHTELNYQDDKKSLDTDSTRAEGWFIKAPKDGLYLNHFINEQLWTSAPNSYEASRASSSLEHGNLPSGWRNNAGYVTEPGQPAIEPSGWIPISGSTPTFGTGPSGSHSRDFYMYAETSVPNIPGRIFGLVTPEIDALDIVSNFSATFYYHMHGFDCGELKVQYSHNPVFDNPTDLTTNWNGVEAVSIGGPQQVSANSAWKPAVVDLSEFVGSENSIYLRFLYTSGITHLGDVAIDSVNVVGKVIESFRLYDVTYADVTRPRATYYRDEFAKRPINIRNIKMTSSSPTRAGNYTENYQVVHTQGRDVNNLWLVQGDTGSAWQPSVSTYVSGVLDFRLPNRDYLTAALGPAVHGHYSWPDTGSINVRNRTVFAERFSAPGGPEVLSRGAMDITSETYSVYNALPWRNLSVRKPLQGFLTMHSRKYGFLRNDYTDAVNFTAVGTASYHKTHRNTGYKRQLEGGPGQDGYNIVVSASHDNYFVQHMIPRSERQYAWITASLSTHPHGESAPLGYTTASFSIDKKSSEITFLSASHVADTGENIDFIGLNTLVNSPITININTRGTPSINTSITTLSSDYLLNAVLLRRNGPYGYPSWKQIRTGDHPIAKNLRNNNLFVKEDKVTFVEQEAEVYSPGGGGLSPVPVGFKKVTVAKENLMFFTESAITSRNKPLVTTFQVNAPLGADAFALKHTYDNNFTRYKNNYLNVNAELPFAPPGPQIYDQLLPIMQDGTDQFGSETDIGNFAALRYSTTIFPKDVNTYLSKARRSNYTEPAGAVEDSPGIAGYDSQKHRTFWRDSLGDRLRTDGTARNMSGQRISYDALGGTTGSIIDMWGMKSDRLPVYTASMHLPVALSVWPLDENTFGASLSASTNLNMHTDPGVAYEGVSATAGVLGLGSWIVYDRDLKIPAAPAGEAGMGIPGTTYGTQGSAGQLAMDISLHLRYGIPTASAFFNRDPYNNWHAATASSDSDGFFVSGTLFQTPAQTTNEPIEFGYGSTNLSDFYKNAPANQTSWIKTAPYYRANKIAGKNPWYDSYDEYNEDIRRFGKEYANLAEYRMSEKVDDYLAGFDNFIQTSNLTEDHIASSEESTLLRTNNKTFILDGAYSSTSSYKVGNNAFPSWNLQFINDHVVSDPMVSLKKVYSEITDQNLENQERNIPKEITLKCDSIKKLLPYNGFYPVTRAQQLATLFSQSLGPNIKTTGSSGPHNNDLREAGKMQAAYQPLFAPGILFNSIKSGVAVDWPAYVNSSADTSDNFDIFGVPVYHSSGSVISTDPDYRVPFRALIDMDLLQPPSPIDASTVTFNASQLIEPAFGTNNTTIGKGRQFDWNNGRSHSFMFDGERGPKFEIAMNNFVSEVPNFFLKSRGRKGIFSTSDEKIGEIQGGKTYYMDVVLEKVEKQIDYDFVMAEGPRDQLILRHYTSSATDSTIGHALTFHDKAGPRKGYIFGPPAMRSASAAVWSSVESPSSNNEWRSLSGSDSVSQAPVDGRATDSRHQHPHLQDARLIPKAEMDPCYSMYTPPYYYGRSIARVKWTAPTDGTAGAYTIKEIISEIKAGTTDKVGVETFNEFDNIIIPNSNVTSSLRSPKFRNLDTHLRAIDLLHPDSIAAKNTMSITASLDLLTTVPVKNTQYGTVLGPDGKYLQTGYSDSDGADKYVWAIRPKWECPVIDISASSYDPGYNHDVENGPYFSQRTGRCIWHGYSNMDPPAAYASQGIFDEDPTKPSDTKGLKYYVKESFGPNTYLNSHVSGSLMKLLKFSDGENDNYSGWSFDDSTTQKRIGVLADRTEVAECIVAIPYVDEPINRVTYQPFNKVANGKFINAIAINADEYYRQFVRLKEGKLPVESRPDTKDTTISELIKAMRKYIFPPEIDFYSAGIIGAYPKTKVEDSFGRKLDQSHAGAGISPFIMYTFEISSDLDEKGLGDVWQNLLPSIGTKAEKQSEFISHPLHNKIARNEFFGQLDLIVQLQETGRQKTISPEHTESEAKYKELFGAAGNKEAIKKIFNQEIKWLVFKVKKRANNSYDMLMNLDSYKNGKPDINIKERLSYNWPHDFYSLAELNKLTAEITIGPEEE